MKLSRLNLLALALVAAAFALAWWYEPRLPDPVPTHWGADGQADGWTPKPWGVWMFPVLGAVVAGILLVLPIVAPRGWRLDEARRPWDIVVLIVTGFLVALMTLAFHEAAGGEFGMDRGLPFLLGALFMLLGNYLAKFPKNFFVGIRTPWTLASDAVWYRTHRLGGWSFMVAGVLLLVAGAAGMGLEPWLFATVLVLAALVPVLYSLWLYRRLHGFAPDSGENNGME